MKILAVSTKLPYPLIDGQRICFYQAVRGLASRGHEVHIVAIVEEADDIGPLEDFCRVHVLRHRPLPTAAGALATLLIRRPYTQWKKDLPQVYRYLDRLQSREGFDAVYADQAHTACYGSYMKKRYGLPYLLRLHNMEHEIHRRYADHAGNPLMRLYLRLQCKRWERYEFAQIRAADACAAITHRDSVVAEGAAPGIPVGLIPAAVDPNIFPFVSTNLRKPRSLVAVGNMDWAPNRDAINWFVNSILPLVVAEEPGVVCHIVGAGSHLEGFRNSKNLRLVGKIDSIHDLYEQSAVGVIPLRVGSGMRFKMLEMMSCGLPVVSTAIGAEGNAAVAGVHYLCADYPVAFAAAITSLLRNPAEQERLSLAARAFVVEHYNARDVGKKCEDMLIRAIAAQPYARRNDVHAMPRGAH